MFQRIMVPVDGSEGAKNALQIAIGLQKLCDGELIVLTVYRHHSLLEASMSMVRPEEPEIPDDTLREYATQIAESAKAFAIENGSKAVRVFVKVGQPARTIVGFAKDRKVDLIVLGSRGLGDLDGYLLGSVSHKVTSLADCPVLVV